MTNPYYSDAGVPTPGRRTLVLHDVPDQQLKDRSSWSIRRVGREIGHSLLPNQPQSDNVTLTQRGAWIIQPKYHVTHGAVLSESSRYDSPGNAQMTPEWGSITTHKKSSVPNVLTAVPTDNPTLGSGSIVSTGGTVWQKQVPAGSLGQSEFTADVNTLPKFTTAQIFPNDYPELRQILGTVSYPENTPFEVTFAQGTTIFERYNILTFYFGGSAQIIPANFADPVPRGGYWAVKILGGGLAKLGEYINGTWRLRKSFRWATGNKTTGHFHHFGILPLADDTIEFYSNTSDRLSDTVDWGMAQFAPIAQDRTALYVESAAEAKQTHVRAIEGPGIWRLDMANSYFHHVKVLPGHFDRISQLVDGPFSIQHDVPVNTPITIHGRYHSLRNAHLSVDLFDAVDNSPLPLDAFGNFLTQAAGRRVYYPIFTFYPSADGFNSPILYYYSASTPGSTHVGPVLPVSIGRPRKIEITGHDQTPDRNTASCDYRDAKDDLSIFRKRSRVHTSIQVQTSSGQVITELFRGETARPTSTKIGRVEYGTPRLKQFPSEEWRDYHGVRYVGEWARIADQRFIGIQNFQDDGTVDAQGKANPWKVTDIILFLLKDAGYAANQILIPDYGTRLWPSPDLNKNDYTITPASSYVDILFKLTKEFLGQYLIFDENASSALPKQIGVWRLIANPTPPYSNPLYAFLTRRPLSARGSFQLRTVMSPYPAVSYQGKAIPMTWIEDESFHEDIEPPEFTYLSVTTAGQLLPNGSRYGYQNFAWNPDAIYYNPNNPADYIGREVPLHVVDPYLGGGDPKTSQFAVDSLLWRLYDFAGHARPWVGFHAPQVFVRDPLDRYQERDRILRINDTVLVGSPDTGWTKGIVRTYSPNYDSDKWQKGEMRVILKPGN